MSSINCKGKLIDLDTPKVMGILNITPDSFFDGGKFKSDANILKHTEKMLSEGATFIDVGGYSSRPNAQHISEDEELKRVIPVVELLIKKWPEVLISIDTFRSNVATKCVNIGACMINDISAGNMDVKMFTTVAKLQVPYIIMHMQGTPQTMQKTPKHVDIVHEVVLYFSKKVNELHALNVNDIIIDVGFGFGKAPEENYELLKNLSLLKNLEVPILTGISRKSMLYKLLDITPAKALNATTVANTMALLNGTNILRVHDVKEAVEAIIIVNAIESKE
ncbi:MAG: dihydropteroate synthase [Aureibaculum sp.]|nr:dihydropteroate synthase [Aureibaculum sp.]